VYGNAAAPIPAESGGSGRFQEAVEIMKRLHATALFSITSLLAGVFATGVLANATPPSSVLPQFAFGGGWYSALYFTNSTSAPASFAVNFTGNDGTPLTVPSLGASTTQVNLAANGTAMIEAPNAGSLVQGYATFTLPPGVFGYGVFRQSVPGKLDQEAVVPLSDATATSNTLTWDETSLITAVAMVNPSAVAATVNVTLWDEDGNTVGTYSVALPAYNKTAATLRSLPGLSGIVGKRGSAQFSVSTGNVAVLGLRFDGLAFTSIPTATPASIVLSRSSVLPQLAFGGGWYSALYFTNTTSSPVSFPVNFISNAGTPLSVPSVGGSTAQVALAANGTAAIEAPNEGGLVQGYAAVTLPAGVFGYGVFRQSVPGQLDQEAVVPLSSAQGTSTTLTWDETSLITAVAMVNPGSTAATGTVTLWDEDDNLIGTSPISLSAGNKTAATLRSLTGLSGMIGKRGSAQFRVSTGNIAVLGLRFNGLAFTSIPTTGPQASTTVSAVVQRALAQTGLSIGGMASSTFESQIQILKVLLGRISSCTALPGGGSIQPGTPITVYYDNACTQPYISANAELTMTAEKTGYITETATYYGLNGTVIGSLTLTEYGQVSTGSATMYGTGAFISAGGAQTPVQVGMYCTLTASLQEPCGGGIVQDFPTLGMAIGVVPALTIDIGAKETAPPATFTGIASPVTGPLGSLKLTDVSATSIVIAGGTQLTSFTVKGNEPAMELFPPPPTGWTVTDSADDQQLQITVAEGTTPFSVTLTIIQVSTGATLATGVVDQSGSGAIIYSDGTTSAIANWTLLD